MCIWLYLFLLNISEERKKKLREASQDLNGEKKKKQQPKYSLDQLLDKVSLILLQTNIY